MFHPWSTGNDRAPRFGCREIKVPSAPIFLTHAVYRHVVLLLRQYIYIDRTQQRYNIRT